MTYDDLFGPLSRCEHHMGMTEMKKIYSRQKKKPLAIDIFEKNLESKRKYSEKTIFANPKFARVKNEQNCEI